jgi:hypothetical protein
VTIVLLAAGITVDNNTFCAGGREGWEGAKGMLPGRGMAETTGMLEEAIGGTETGTTEMSEGLEEEGLVETIWFPTELIDPWTDSFLLAEGPMPAGSTADALEDPSSGSPSNHAKKTWFERECRN